MLRTAFLWAATFFAGGCAPAAPQQGAYPPRPDGCDIQVFPEAPPVQTDNIGPVSATCSDVVSDADCMRTLKDQACKVGADVVWGVEPNPTPQAGKKRLFGRAAHTKAGAASK